MGLLVYISVRRKMKQKEDGHKTLKTLLWKQLVMLANKGKKREAHIHRLSKKQA